jgi:septum site-determining protein MinD
MAKVLVVTSGKGGVGKTTSTAALGAALAQQGEKVVVVDFDVGLRNLDLIMGAERRVVFDLINVAQGVAKLSQALIRDKRLESLWLLPASQTRDKDALTDEGVRDIIADLRTKFDWVICDSPAGIERGATLAMRYADEAIVVTNPEVSSVRDADRIIGMLDSKTVKAEAGEQMKKHVLMARSSGFFVGRPIVLDLSAVDLSPHGITHLVSNLESRGIRVLGLEGVEATGLETRFPPVHSDNHLFWIQRDVSRDHGENIVSQNPQQIGLAT